MGDRKLLVLAIALAVATTAGCSAMPPTPEASIEPTPTTPADPAATSALAGLVLSPEGIGPIVYGEPVPAFDPNTEPVVWDETFCDWSAELRAEGYVEHPGWKANYPMSATTPFIVELGGGDEPSSPVDRITIWSAEIRTADDLGIGSALADLQDAYGAKLLGVPDGTYPGYAVMGDHGQLVFWFDAYSEQDAVYMVSVLDPNTPAAFAYDVGGCV